MQTFFFFSSKIACSILGCTGVFMFAFQVKSMLMWKVQYKALWEGKGEKSIFPLLVLFLNRIFRSVGFFFFFPRDKWCQWERLCVSQLLGYIVYFEVSDQKNVKSNYFLYEVSHFLWILSLFILYTSGFADTKVYFSDVTKEKLHITDDVLLSKSC